MKGFLSIFGKIWAGLAHIFGQVLKNNLYPISDFAIHLLIGVVGGAVLPAVKSYILMPGAPLTFGGLTPVITGAFLTGIVSALKHDPSQIISTLAANVTPDQIANANTVIDAKVLALIPKPKSAVPPSAGLFLIGLLLLAGSSFAANPISVIGVPVSPTLQEDDFLLMPFTNVNIYTANGKTNYGLGVAYGLAYANVNPQGDGSYQVSPFCYVAPYCSLEIANWINSATLSPVSVDYGLMVGLPQLDPSIAQVGLTINWNSLNNQFLDSHPTIGISAAFPLDVLSGGLLRKIN